MTKGQSRVRVSFNPSSDNKVDVIKAKCAELIDLVETFRMTEFAERGLTLDQAGEVHRMASLAQTAFEEGAVWAVKLLTYKP